MTNNLTPSGELILEKLGINPNNLRADFPTREQRLQYRAVAQWITDYKPKSDATNLEKIRGYLETFYHFCKVQDWLRGSEIIFTRLNTPINDELHWQLSIWGYYREQIELYNQLVGKLSPKLEGLFRGNLGTAYSALGNYTQAIDYYQQSLTIAREIGDRQGEGSCLGSLGTAYYALDYYALGNYTQAIDYYQQSLTIAREIGDRQGEGNWLGNLGAAYHSLGDYPQAIDYYQQSLAIAREISDHYGEALSLYKLARVHFKLDDRTQTLKYCNQALSLATELGIPLVKECQELKEKLLRDIPQNE